MKPYRFSLLLRGMTAFVIAGAAFAQTKEPVGNVQDWMFLDNNIKPATYRHMSDLFATRTIKRGSTVYPLPPASDRRLDVKYQADGKSFGIDEFITRNFTTGLLVVKDDHIVLEKYAWGNTDKSRWPSWSMAKSVMSTLLGAAIKDGSIKSVEDPITKYVPALKGTAFDGATLRNLLEMSSGVKWNEDYEDRESDFNHLMKCYYDQSSGCVLNYMSKLPREQSPGAKFVYNTGVSCILGIAVMNATHKHLATYLSEKIWAPFGMENDAIWVLDSKDGQEYGGALIGATLRDYARFGTFIMKGGVAGGKSVLPDGWIDAATHPQDAQVAYGNLRPGNFMGYGYQWWSWPTGAKAEPDSDGVFQAIGIFGQTIYVNPKSKLIVVILSNWPKPGGLPERTPFLEAIAHSLR